MGKASRRPGRAARHGEHVVLASVGWAKNLDELPEVRRRQPQLLMIALGHRQQGPITVRDYTGPHAKQVVTQMLTNATPQSADGYRWALTLLRDYGGYAVVASCPGVRQDAHKE